MNSSSRFKATQQVTEYISNNVYIAMTRCMHRIVRWWYVYTSLRWPRGFNARSLKIQYLSMSRPYVASFRREPFSCYYEFTPCWLIVGCQPANIFLLLVVTHYFILAPHLVGHQRDAGILEFKTLCMLHRGKGISWFCIVISPRISLNE